MSRHKASSFRMLWPSLIALIMAAASAGVLYVQNLELVHGAKEKFNWDMLMDNMGTISAILIIVVVGIICIVQGIFFMLRKIYDMRLPWMGGLLLLVALWAYNDSTLVQLFDLGPRTTRVVEYVCLMGMSIPIIYFTWHTCHRKARILPWLGIVGYLNIFVQCTLAINGVIAVDGLRIVTHALLLISVLVCMVCLLKYRKRAVHPRRLMQLFWGFVILTGFALVSAGLYWMGDMQYYRIIAMNGLVIFSIFMESVIILSYIESLQRNRARVEELRTFEALSQAKGRMMEQLIDCIVSAMEAKDSYTADHSNRVRELAVMIAQKANYTASELEDIDRAANLHDIGKLGIPDRILLKPEALTANERKVMCEHASLGSQIISQVEGMYRISKIILHHHERYDGKGYPDGIAGEEIPTSARIIAIADSIDAMTSDRCYRQALGLEKCREEIEKNLGVMYDPVLGRLTLDNWDEVEEIVLSPTKRKAQLSWMAEVMHSFQG